MINNIIFEIMSWKAENEREVIRKRQAEGIAIAKAKNVKFGRPRMDLPDNFMEACNRWKSGEITGTDAIILTGMKRTNFYKQVKLLNIK